MNLGIETETLEFKKSTGELKEAMISICLPVVGKPGLQPIIGVGDLYFYSAILLFFYIFLV